MRPKKIIGLNKNEVKDGTNNCSVQDLGSFRIGRAIIREDEKIKPGELLIENISPMKYALGVIKEYM